MPWYEFKFVYGPGHQASDTWHKWLDQHDEEYLKELGHEHARDHYMDDTQYKFTFDVLDKLPEDVRIQKIKQCENTIRGAQYMLGILKNS